VFTGAGFLSGIRYFQECLEDRSADSLSSLADVKVGGVYGIPSLCPIFVGKKKSKMFSSE
jgi:hypothetical protein